MPSPTIPLDRRIPGIVLPPPHQQAFKLFTPGQRIFWLAALLAVVVALSLSWHASLLLLNACVAVFYILLTLYKVVIIQASTRSGQSMAVSPEELAALDRDALPRYTILVPLFHEAAVLPHLVQGLAALDYPPEKLQILLVFEETDADTLAAWKHLDVAAPFEAVIVPDCHPRTKPKACDAALPRANGEYLVIYDAEDRPEPDQLLKAVAAFRKAPPEVVCLQARLNFYNRDHNLLTRWFTVDYSTWFDLYLPGLARFDAPIPLGGTSNHFKIQTLLAIGAWDPYNVAEDCDLGMRLYRQGYRTRILDSTTWEEACSHLGFWIRQRSRWIKGYIQTFCVHTRNPLRTLADLGPRRTLDFLALTGGMFFTYLVNPFYWMLTLLWIVYRTKTVGQYFPPPVFVMGFVCLFLGNFALVYASMLGCCSRRYYHLVKYALLIPPYWAMVSIAAWKAFWQLIVNPHYWEKTKHGLHLPAHDAAHEDRTTETA